MKTRKDEIIEAVRNGESRSAVARRLGIDLAYVSRMCTAAMGYAQKHKTKGLRVDYDRVSRLYRAGCNDCEIARQIGAHSQTIKYWRDRNNLPAHERGGGVVTEANRKAAALVAEGKTYTEAANLLGISRNAVAGAVCRAKVAAAQHKTGA